MKSSPHFSRGTLSASACMFTVVVLMVVNPFLAMTFFLSVVYAVVPLSLWRKHQQLAVRTAVVVTCLMGYGIILAGVGFDIYRTWQSQLNMDGPLYPVMISPLAALVAGISFLPLAAFGSLQTLRTHLKNRSSEGDSSS